MSLRLFSWALYVGVGVFFAVAATVKILDPDAFLSSLLTYEVFPNAVAIGLAHFAPILELLVALCLMSGILRQGAMALTVAMLVLFIVLVAQGLARGLELDCGCFGSNQLHDTTDYLIKMGQNTLLLAAVVLARFFEVKSKNQSIQA